MRLWTLSFLGGVLALVFLHSLPALYWLVGLVPLGVLFHFFGTRGSSRGLVLLGGLLAGFAWALFCGHGHFSHGFSSEFEGKPLVVRGHVASLPRVAWRFSSFEFLIEDFLGEGVPLEGPMKVKLGWYNDAPAVHVGDEWQLTVKLKRPHGLANPGGFDFESWAFQRDLKAMGYVKSGVGNHLVRSEKGVLVVDRVRQAIQEGISRYYSQVKGTQYGAFIKGLTIGVKDEITQPQWTVLRNTGTSHLMAISGLHIGLVAGFAFFLVNFLWRWVPWLTLRFPAPQAGALAALLAGTLYAALAGFSLPTQRAMIMLAVFMGGILSRRKVPPWQGLSVALLFILVHDPFAVLSPGFWLSFGAVAVILYAVTGRLKSGGKLWQWWRVQSAVTLGLLPLSLWFFQQTALNALFANLIAIPWVGFVVIPLSLVGSLLVLPFPQLGGVLLGVANKLFAVFWPWLTWLGGMEQWQWHQGIPSLWVLLAAMLGTLLLLAPKGWPGRWIGVVALLPLFIVKPLGPHEGEVWFTLLDVGQGLASVVETEHHTLVFDAGAKFRGSVDMGDSVVMPFLRKRGISTIDLLVISHGDNDHIGGAWSILKQSHVKQVATSVPERFKQVPSKHCYAGEKWEWDQATFEFLHPTPEDDFKGNDASCVLKITANHKTILLTGDIEKKAERFILATQKDKLSADILVAPHHGSRTSSTKNFVEAVNPTYTLLPLGYRNRYRFPSHLVVERYEKNHARLFDSANSGAITFKIGKERGLVPPAQYRMAHKRIWALSG